MKTRALTTIAGVALLAGSAALYAMSVQVDGADDGTGQARRAPGAVAPPAFSVVVTQRRSTPGHSMSGSRSRAASRSIAWRTATTDDHGWGRAVTEPRH